MRADVFRRSGRSAPDCSREVGPDGAAATGRRMPRTETIDSTFSLSRAQSRTCSVYAEAGKRRTQFNIFINKTFGLFIGSGRMRRPLFHLRFEKNKKIRFDRSIHFRLALSLHPEKFVSL